MLPWQESVIQLTRLSLLVAVRQSNLVSAPAFSQLVNDIHSRRQGSDEQQILVKGQRDLVLPPVCASVGPNHSQPHRNPYPSGQRLGLENLLQKRNVDDGQLAEDRPSDGVEEKGIAEESNLPEGLLG